MTLRQIEHAMIEIFRWAESAIDEEFDAAGQESLARLRRHLTEALGALQELRRAAEGQ